MKFLIQTFFVLFIGTITVQAQFSAGAKAGFNLSTLVVDDGVSEYGFAPGFQLGGFLDYSLTKVSFQADVVYSRQGASIDADGEDLKAIAQYVNVPVVVKYKILPAFNLQVGPQIGFLTCIRSDYHPVISEPFQEQHYTKAYKKTDFGVTVGAGWESPRGIMIDARYYLGLTDINNYEGLESTKNNVIMLTVGYRIIRF
ncbi:MAG TPA: porin family protein [Cyclobacteriaceae bacterium]|nr:porin family protein [Cyclobacteriaceae bacterium]